PRRGRRSRLRWASPFLARGNSSSHAISARKTSPVSDRSSHPLTIPWRGTDRTHTKTSEILFTNAVHSTSDAGKSLPRVPVDSSSEASRGGVFAHGKRILFTNAVRFIRENRPISRRIRSPRDGVL